MLGPIQRVAAAYGAPKFLGTIAATTTINNHDTATPFNNTGDALKNKCLLIQPDADCHVLPGITNAATVTTTNGLKIGADERVVLTMGSDMGWLAVVGAANVKVWELT